jgi:hypothetical protein
MGFCPMALNLSKVHGQPLGSAHILFLVMLRGEQTGIES